MLCVDNQKSDSYGLNAESAQIIVHSTSQHSTTWQPDWKCMSLWQKWDIYVVKIRHQNCLLQVNHGEGLCLKIIFSLTKICAIHKECNLKVADQSDLVKPDTGCMYNSSAVEKCYWALLGLFVVSTVCKKCKYFPQNNIVENMAFSYDIVVPVKT